MCGSDVWVGGESLSCHSPWVCGVWRGGRLAERWVADRSLRSFVSLVRRIGAMGGFHDRSFSLVRRSPSFRSFAGSIGVCRSWTKKFFLWIVRRIGSMGGWIDRGFSLVRRSSSSGSFGGSSLWVAVVFFVWFFCSFSLPLSCCVLSFFSPSLCGLQDSEMN